MSRRSPIFQSLLVCLVLPTITVAHAAPLSVPRDLGVAPLARTAEYKISNASSHCPLTEEMHTALWSVASLYKLLPALPHKRQTRQLCSRTPAIPRHVETSPLVHRIAAGKVVQQDKDYQLEQSPLDRILPYIEREAGLGIEKPKDFEPPYDESEERLRIGVEATQMFNIDERPLSEFGELMDGYRKSKERTRSGISKLGVVYQRFFDQSRRILADEDYHNQRLKKIADWQQQQPEALTPKMMKAVALREFAFATLTDSSLVARDKNRKLFLQRLDPLESYLNEIKDKVATQDSHWYVMMLEVRGAKRAKSAELFSLLDEASKAFPDEMDVYIGALESIARSASNPLDDLDNVAMLASVRGESEGKSAFYARSYWYIINRVVGASRAPALNIDWARFAEGAREVIAKYPVQWNIQHFAAFLCFGGEAEQAHELFKSVEGRPIRQAWGDIAVHDKCRDWAADPTNRYRKNGTVIEN